MTRGSQLNDSRLVKTECFSTHEAVEIQRNSTFQLSLGLLKAKLWIGLQDAVETSQGVTERESLAKASFVCSKKYNPNILLIQALQFDKQADTILYKDLTQ